MRASIVIPCFGRPVRTRRMIECLGQQTINRFEAFIIGDGCSDFQALLDSEDYKEWVEDMSKIGNRVVTFNMDKNYGGCGYQIINYAIQKATGKYFMFGGNDDMIDKDHIEYYLSEIEGTDYDMVYYNSLIRPDGDTIRDAILQCGGIGHSEIIVKTSLAKLLPPHTSEYGHDWTFIESVLKAGGEVKKAANPYKVTYHVMSVGPGKRRVDFEIN